MDANTFLSHHGILGQKWGIRRYQNSDGTLTEDGKIRYKKNPSKMSDEDLRNAVNRLQMEATYRRLVKELNTPEIKKKKEHPLFKQIFVTSSAAALSSVINALAKETIQNKIAKSIVENPDKLKEFNKTRDIRDMIFNPQAYENRQNSKKNDDK